MTPETTKYSDFSFLLESGSIGFYNKCEVIEIFGFDLKINQPFNIFTLIVFEDSQQHESEELLTKKLEKFKLLKNIKWGIKRRVITIEKAKSLFENLQNKNTFKITDEIKIGSLQFLNKQYVQPNDSFVAPQINYVLKNNFHSGSYLIEGVDSTKENIKFLLDEPTLLNDFSEKVHDIIPISIGAVSDRLGNVLFQFPINIFKVKLLTLGLDEGIQLDFFFNPKLKKEPSLQIIAQNKTDDILFDYIVQDIINNEQILMDTSSLTTLQVFDKGNNLIVYKNSFNSIKNIVMNMDIISPQNRFFFIDKEQHRITVSHKQSPDIIGSQSKLFSNWVYNRKYEQELKDLEQSKSFTQYKGINGDKEKALNNIRSLIHRYGRSGVYLWDPYLSAKDIKETLYFCKNYNVKLKAITDIKHIQSEVKEFQRDDSKYLMLDLEVRRKYKNYGHKFHDRFLIFPLEQPKIWSLGTSINSVGMSHHIIQEVQHSQHILNSFNELWEELNHEECLVWKST